jgi:hypothetical protein
MSWTHSSYTPALTEDSEVWTTVTERENDVFAVYSESGIGATKYIILIDKDNVAWPHLLQGQSSDRIDIGSMYIALDAAVNTNGILSIGVISRVDGTNADAWYIFGVPFLATTTQFILSLRGTPSQAKMDLNGEALLHGITNNRETDIAAVNTATLLDSPAGASSVIPAVGDIICKLEHVSGGSFNVGLFAFYHGH